MNWHQRGSKLLSVFFYGYGASVVPVGAFVISSDPVNFTFYNLLVYPALGGFILIFPQLGKIFGEIANDKKS